ncbi:MAG: DNA polymerase III subunit chi [Burkholderiales bacterium]|nr:DNA polymerase III subunit chi [Burkholderiales bacterium]
MTEITFYFNSPDKLATTRALAAKACGAGKRMLIYASDAAVLETVDAFLWTTPHTGFLPHCRAGDRLADHTPVLLTADAEAMPHHEILLNLDTERPALFSRFDRLLEIVSRDDEHDRACARERFRFYRDRGYAIVRHDLGRGSS